MTDHRLIFCQRSQFPMTEEIGAAIPDLTDEQHRRP